MAKSIITLQQARVLVVEDDPNNRLVITKLLQLAGVPAGNIFAVEDDIASYLHTRPPGSVDLILLDLRLPKKDGYAILSELRADPALADIRIVALTANVMRQDIMRAQAAGFDGFIGKPIDGQRFPAMLRDILAGQSVWPT
jgi:two-component system cell cycle response regulator DivK